MNLDNIKEELEDYLKKEDLKLFDLTYNKSDKTLSILLDEQLTMDRLEEISNDLSNYMDKYDGEFEDNYILDVSTVGVERPIRNEDELKQAIGQYIYVLTKESEHYGILKDYADGILHMECKDKTRIINVSVDYSETKIVRYAVEF